MDRSATAAMLGVCALLAGPAAAQQAPQEVWSLGGFQAPESVLFDEDRNVFYVSNVAGNPDERNGAGHLSRVSADGEMLEAEWVVGLDAPKGLVRDGATLYVTDIDRLVAVDLESGEIAGAWTGEGAQFLNDPAIDEAGRVYVSDMLGNAVYVLDGDDFSVWLQDEALQHPNGLYVDGGGLVVAAWGQQLQADFSTAVPGHLIRVDLETREISALGSGEPVGNLDGLAPDGDDGWLATDWVAGALLRIRPDGSFEQLLDLEAGSADLGTAEGETLVVIPMMQHGRIDAYRLP